MLVTIFLGILSTFFAYISKFNDSRWGIRITFFLIYLFLALRFNFGNDYEWYQISFDSISGLTISDFLNTLLPYEPGYVILNWIFRDAGFFLMTAFLAIFNCIIYYKFISKHLPRNLYWLAIIIYIFQPSFLLLQSSAMRQSISIMLFIFSTQFIQKREFIKYLICIILAILFHYTAFFLLPIYFFFYKNDKLSDFSKVLFFIIYISLFLLSSSISPYFKILVGVFSEKYEYYQNAAVTNSGLGFLYYSFLFILTLYFEKSQSDENRLLFKISIISFLIIPLALIIDMTGRIGMYFSPATIVVFPLIFKEIKNKYGKFLFASVLILLTLFQFFQFMFSDNYMPYFFHYKTIFSSILFR